MVAKANTPSEVQAMCIVRVVKKFVKDFYKRVPGPTDSSRRFHQNPRLVAGMRRASGRNENHHDGRSDYMPGPRTRIDNN